VTGERTIKYVAQVEPVREVSLVGTADLGFWTERLAAEKLCPSNYGGQARMTIGATDARFKGIRFRELTVTVFCRPREDSQQDGLFLAQAFNSVRWFAWVERNLFSTPYDHAAIDVECQWPASFQLTQKNEVLLGARMAAGGSREEPSVGDFAWRGPVYLPRGNRGGQKYFWAKIGGETHGYPFDGTCDVLSLQPNSGQRVVDLLIESRFAAFAWAVREAAAHAKSKTYCRP
jgi:hypothetical protein